MNKFITRVELHGAQPHDYERLHDFMAAYKFRRTIISDQGQEFDLPAATYFSFGDLSAADVRTLAMTAADCTGRASWVLITRYEEAAWSLRPTAPVAPPVFNLLGLRSAPNPLSYSPSVPPYNALALFRK